MILVDVSSEKIILGGLLVNYRLHVGQLLIIDMSTDISNLELCTVTEQSSTGQHSDRVSTAIDEKYVSQSLVF